MPSSASPVGVKEGWAKRAVMEFFEYTTPKFVQISSLKVGVINRICQLIIIGYIVGFVIIYKKGYQDFENVVSGTTTKLKGVAQTNYTALNITGPGGIDFRIWDVADYVIPPQENEAFFVMTNVVFTPNQTQEKCPEDPQYSRCVNESNCKAGAAVINGNGIQTGKCVPSDQYGSANVCQIYAWCPVEVDKLPVANDTLVQGTEEFTVLIKSNVEFPKFNAKSRNILDSQNQSYLQSCHYKASDPTDKFCPIFILGDIVRATGNTYHQLAVMGGVIGINIEWNCDLDYNIKYCIPVYSFSRLDTEDAKIAKGTNFRYANYYGHSRDLYKAYGIRFLIRVTGRAGKFSIIPLLLNVGSGIGLLAIATVIADMVTLYVLEKRNYYKDNKYQNLNESQRTTDTNELNGEDSPSDDDRLIDDHSG